MTVGLTLVSLLLWSSICYQWFSTGSYIFDLSISPCVDINRVQLLGRVGRDPEQRGEMHPVVFFPLATTLTVRASAEDEDGTGCLH